MIFLFRFCLLTALLSLWTSGFLQAQSAPATNVGLIKKNILKNKKTLADLKKKLKEE